LLHDLIVIRHLLNWGTALALTVLLGYLAAKGF
jgi:hypothetical protein